MRRLATISGRMIMTKNKNPAPFKIEIENGAVKAADSGHGVSISATDISGDIVQRNDGTLDARLRGLVNDTPSRLELAIADVVRVRAKGSPADISLTSDDAQVELSGLLATAGRLRFDGSISAEATDAGRFLKWLGLTLDGLVKPTTLAFDAGLSLSGSGAALTDLAFAVGDMKGKGKLSVQAASPRPQVKAELSLTTLDFGIYGKDNGNGAAQQLEPGISKGWREKPFDLSDLGRIDAIFALTVDAIKAVAMTTGPANLTAVLADGRLKANIVTRQFHGGTGQVTIELQGGARARLGLEIVVKDAEAKDFLSHAFDVNFLSGSTSLAAKLTASGNSQAELISTLAGSSQISLKKARIEGLDIAELAGAIAKQDATGWGLTHGKATLVASADVNAEFADGIVTLNEGSRLEMAGFSLVLGGTIDVLRQALGLEVKPDKRANLPLPVAVRISGPWGEPKLSARIDGKGVNDFADEAAQQAKKTFSKLFGN